MAEGWIKLHRMLKDKPIWKCSTPEQKVILITLLMMVNSKEAEWEWQGKKFKVRPGQMITSANSIMKECGQGISRQNIRTALDKFEKYDFLTKQSTKTGMLVTIENWGTYQSTEKNQPSYQPSANQEVTTNKKDKKDKNIYIGHFDAFWNTYPRKVGKAAAEKSFKKLNADDGLLKVILLAIDNQKQSKQWSDKQFIPHPATWINQRRWEDEIDNAESSGELKVTADGTFKI